MSKITDRITPTFFPDFQILDAMSVVDHRFATKNFHWFLFAQDSDLPELLLLDDNTCAIA